MTSSRLARVALLGCLLAAACGGQKSPPLNSARIATIESTLVLPAGAARLQNYERYYATATRWYGGSVLRAVYSQSDKHPGVIHVVTEGELPVIADGGCGVVRAEFDRASGRLLHIACNGSPPIG